uniref:Uncharacterized protein n=1 Tax=Anguilla anguilla TaxID=7936 RepID=A0A0E9P6A0_ANGAN
MFVCGDTLSILSFMSLSVILSVIFFATVFGKLYLIAR